MIYLAAGNSRRFGSNKLYYNICIAEEQKQPDSYLSKPGVKKTGAASGKPMFRYGLEALEQVLAKRGDTELVVVTEYEMIREYVLERKKHWKERITLVGSPDRDKGISCSIRAGLAGGDADYYLFCVADQPWIRSQTILNLIHKTTQEQLAGGYVCWGEEGGNPTIFSRELLPELLSLTGDRGGKKLLLGRSDVCRVQAKTEEELRDLDIGEVITIRKQQNLDSIRRKTMTKEQQNIQIPLVALIGAGAVGAYFIYGMTGLEGINFCVVAEGTRAEKLKKEGVTINEKVYYPEIRTPQEAKGADLVLVCTKYQGLLSACDMLEVMVEENTTVVSLLNGIDSEEIIAERIGAEHLLYSVMRISSERRNGKITFVPENVIGVAIGEKGIPEATPRVQFFADLMKRAGLKCSIKEDILLDQWSKYSMNMIYNLPQAILGVGFYAFYDSSNVAAIRDKMFEEVCLVADAEGIPLKRQADWRSACLKNARFSTLQDLDAGRHTEIEMFGGALLKLAKKHRLEVPFCEFCYYAIKALEEKGDGLFNYN